MNTRLPIEGPDGTASLSVAFSDDLANFAVGLQNGFCVLRSEDCSLQLSRPLNGGIGLVSLLANSNMVGLVGGGRQPRNSSNKLVLWNEKKEKFVLEISCLTPIRGCRLSASRIVIALQTSVRVYRYSRKPELLTTYETASNPYGLLCASDGIMALPGRTSGQVQLVRAQTGSVTIIPAHSSALRAMQLSADGEMLATASEKGTLIRIFATSNCARVAELRRGVDSATIFSLAFNPSGTTLACTSDKATLHVFDIVNPDRTAYETRQEGSPSPQARSPTPDGDGTSKWGILGKIPMMPRLFSDVYSFATASFDAGEQPVRSQPLTDAGQTPARPLRGVIGWETDSSILVIGAGTNAKWEKFCIRRGADGRRECARMGWKNYMGQLLPS